MIKLFKNLAKTRTKKYNFEELKITGYLVSPLFLNDPINFDAIIYYAFIRYYIGSEYFNLDSNKQKFNLQNLNLPIQKSNCGNYFLSSIGVYNNIEFIQNYRRRYNEVSVNNWCEPRKIVTRKGKYKNYDRPMILSQSCKIEFFCIGDKKEISKLLSKVLAIGKKQSQGLGLIDKWIITKEKGEIIRSINCEQDEAIGFGRLQPPYYSMSNKSFYKYAEIN
jgi:hypothetical protein